MYHLHEFIPEISFITNVHNTMKLLKSHPRVNKGKSYTTGILKKNLKS